MLKLPNNQKIYFYRLGWYGYEGSGAIYLAHTKQYTVRQWENMLKEATIIVAKAEHKKNQKQHCERHNLPKNWKPMTKDELIDLWEKTKGEYDDIYEFAWRVTDGENVYDNLTWYDLYEDVAKYLVKHHGFNKVEAPKKFSFYAFESEDLADEHDYDSKDRSGWNSSMHPLFRALNELVREKVVAKIGDEHVYANDILGRMGYSEADIEEIRKTHYNKEEAARKAKMTPEELQATEEMEEALLAAFASSEPEDVETPTEI